MILKIIILLKLLQMFAFPIISNNFQDAKNDKVN